MNDIDPVMHRLAKANPAPGAGEGLPADSWTVLLDTIRERSGKMQHTETTPLWRRGPVIATAVFVLMLGAVAVFMSISPTDSAEIAGPTVTNQPVATTVSPVTTTPTTVTPVTAIPAIPGVGLPGPGEPWDMLIIAHGRAMGEAIPQMYAERAEQDLGVAINLHYNEGVHPYAWTVLEHIGGGRYPDLSDLISQAEIIVLQTWPENPDEGNETAIDADAQNCRGSISMTDPQPPPPTSAEYWQPYRELLDAIYTEIWALREGTPTVLITVDRHNAYLGEQREAGIDAECAAWQEAWSSIVADAAIDNGSTMVSIYDVLNGPDHALDPVEMGYLGPSEQTPALLWSTPNDVPAGLVVDELAAVGFEPRPMP